VIFAGDSGKVKKIIQTRKENFAKEGKATG
jgi:hypothetical protein